MGDLIRLLALDGPVVGVGVLLALAWLIARLESTRSENAAAHEGITRNVDDVRQQLTRNVDDVKHDVRDVKQDVRMLTAHLLSRKPSESDD